MSRVAGLPPRAISSPGAIAWINRPANDIIEYDTYNIITCGDGTRVRVIICQGDYVAFRVSVILYNKGLVRQERRPRSNCLTDKEPLNVVRVVDAPVQLGILADVVDSDLQVWRDLGVKT